ncbi:MAG: phosphoenolpyruvate synthase [Acidobacteria bacterium]|nr:MAG: phosphoenolpyruvate synthase [Acidobacteriota bacterium]
MGTLSVGTGIASLDNILQRLRLGDNVVWQVENLEDYQVFARAFAESALRDARRLVYIRFAAHAPVLPADWAIEQRQLDPRSGFDVFSANLQEIIEQEGREVFYVFDNLSALVSDWGTDELLANFFQITCPYLFELDTVAYFALTRTHHSNRAIARIRDTTQVLIDLYRVKGQMYVQPLKVWDRYSSEMFRPHRVTDQRWVPVIASDDAAEVSLQAYAAALAPARRSIAPWDSVYTRLRAHQEAGQDLSERSPEIKALKEELVRMLFGTDPHFLDVANAHFDVNDVLDVRDRVIGSGRIGGKAAGLLLARKILQQPGCDCSATFEDLDSFFIGSDVFFSFLVNNDLFRLRLQVARGPEPSTQDFEEIERRFLEGRFPEEMIDQFERLLDYFGQSPIIVRSSSFLEDSFGNSFAGKYRSEFCANQGDPQQRLDGFLRAVKLVYASALNPDALAYRRKRGLGDSDEQMGILVQRVSGTLYKRYFFPMLAGVAFSRNFHAWSSRIDPQKGAIRLVFGLGTRAVNRVGEDYPRMIAVSCPDLRPELGLKVVKYSQHNVDLLDLDANDLVTLPVSSVLDGGDYPNLHLLVSKLKDGYLMPPYGTDCSGDGADLVLTFHQLIARTDFVILFARMLTCLEKAYGHPVDTEFTASIDGNGQVRVNLLQCRPLQVPGISKPVGFPADIRRERVLFRANRMINGGLVSPISHIIYIDPKKYSALRDVTLMKSLGPLVGRVLKHPELAASQVLTMGPGRWGSSSINLGVNVSYADINTTRVLVEMAREEGGHIPEVSYGTHFFLDLVEDGIVYLPVYPDDSQSEFNQAFFAGASNCLADLLPSAAPWAEYLQLIDVAQNTGGLQAHVVADPQNQRAVCYLL